MTGAWQLFYMRFDWFISSTMVAASAINDGEMLDHHPLVALTEVT